MEFSPRIVAVCLRLNPYKLFLRVNVYSFEVQWLQLRKLDLDRAEIETPQKEGAEPIATKEKLPPEVITLGEEKVQSIP